MKKKFYITTSIAYANAAPHLGHALEFINADAIARYRRQCGDSVLFSTGTDEHGVKIVRRAEELNTTPQKLVDENSEKFRALKKDLNLSWDLFLRTSDRERHWPVAEAIWNILYKNGDLYRKAYEGLYCVGHEAFITEKDMRGGVCDIHKKPPETLREENWFFRLSKYQKKIEKTLVNDAVRVVPEYRKNEMLSFFRDGLEDVSFSRPRKDLSWGIPVPHDESQTMYVWADALINYISVLSLGKKGSIFKKNSPEMKTWWPPELHVVGKDILRFHALIWLGMLLSLKLKLPKKIFVHGFINVEGEKMSKSLGNVLDPVLLAQKYGTDALRYYLLREVPSGEDGNFSIEAFEARYNGDCANGLGNLTARVAALGEKLGPLPFSEKNADAPLKKEIKFREKKFKAYMDCFRFSEALSEVWQLIGFLDRYINAEKPWSVSDRAKLAGIIRNASVGILKISSLLSPLLPETSEKILSMFSVKRGKILITKGASLFPRMP